MSTPPQIMIDDAVLCGKPPINNCFTFTGAQWDVSTTQQGVFQRTMHVVNESSSGIGYSVTFSGEGASTTLEMAADNSTGTAIEVFGQLECAKPLCDFDFSLDGEPLTRWSHEPTSRSIFQLGQGKISNTSATHTLKISNTTSYLLVDYALIDTPLDTPLQGQAAGQLWVNINNTAVTYNGAWNKFYNSEKDCESMQSKTAGDSIGFDFIGDSILVFGQTDNSFPGSVSVNITVDDLSPTTQGFLNSPGSTSDSFFIYYNNSSLSSSQHHIQITVATITEVQLFDFFGFMYHSPQNTLGDAVAPTLSVVPSESPSSHNPIQTTAISRSKSASSIAGPVAGSVAAVVLAALILIFCAHKRRRRSSLMFTPFEPEFPHVPLANSRKKTMSAAVSSTSATGVPDTPSTTDVHDGETSTAGYVRVDTLVADRPPPAYTR
ncbi:hypothetical protein B0H14DRAFT_2585035 [Mycena olivaceomarginata]|nr:hypothetical protein B0H14DRAFT_2585035 [Mycena olivaceomarginata]